MEAISDQEYASERALCIEKYGETPDLLFALEASAVLVSWFNAISLLRHAAFDVRAELGGLWNGLAAVYAELRPWRRRP